MRVFLGGLSVLRPCPLGWERRAADAVLPAVVAGIGDGRVAACWFRRYVLVCHAHSVDYELGMDDLVLVDPARGHACML